MLLFGGVGETRTLAPGISRPTPLAGAPRHQLEYYSVFVINLFIYQIVISLIYSRRFIGGPLAVTEKCFSAWSADIFRLLRQFALACSSAGCARPNCPSQT